MSSAFATIAAVLIAASMEAPPGGPPAMPTRAELPFVHQASAVLQRRFHTVDDALRNGYFRYTDEDQSGAISFVNLQWSSTIDHPCQVWFDKRGHFIGVDYCRPFTSARPHQWSLDPRRWAEFPPHVHFAVQRNGKLLYGAILAPQFSKAGGDPNKPAKATLVRMGLVKDESQVVFVFPFRHVWDLAMWAIPNADGAFAENNPSVIPSAGANGRM
jgi:hypothetical protein